MDESFSVYDDKKGARVVVGIVEEGKNGCNVGALFSPSHHQNTNNRKQAASSPPHDIVLADVGLS